MSANQVLIISLYWAIFVASAWCLGKLAADFISILVSKFKFESKTRFNFSGAYLMLGAGLLSNIFLVEGLAGFFTNNILLMTQLIIIIMSVIIYRPKIKTFHLPKINWQQIPYLNLLLIFGGIALLFSLYAAAMLPPHFWDELSYHLPEAQTIANNHKITAHFESYLFFGNIPKLMEVLYAASISLTGNIMIGPLAHLYHFTVILGLLIFVYQWLKIRFNGRVAAIGFVLLIFCDQLMQNGIIGYIDAATAAFEVASLILAIEWLLESSAVSLSASILLIGFGMASKYSAAPTLLLNSLIYIIGAFRHRVSLKKFGQLFVWLFTLLLIACGYWYIKNAYFYGNPFYPLYFGHRYISDEEYKLIVAAIQQIDTRSLSGFKEFVTNFLTPANIIVFWAIVAVPMAYFLRRQRLVIIALATYTLLYFAYWYLCGSHQDRFVIAAITSATILLGITLGSMRYRWSIPVIVIFAILSFSMINYHTGEDPQYRHSLGEKINYRGLKHYFGVLSTRDFLGQWYGCQYLILDDMTNRGLTNVNVIDNWTVWHDANIGFFFNKIGLVQYKFDLNLTDGEVTGDLKSKSLKYLYFNQNTKDRFARETEKGQVEYRQGRAESEAKLIKNATLIDQQESCVLYQLY